MAALNQITRNINLIASYVIPTLLCAAVGYVTWVFIVLVCVEYFLGQSVHNNASRREEIAIVFLILYFLFLLLMACSYLRLFHVVATNPGYVACLRMHRDRNGLPSQKPDQLPLGAHREASTVNDASYKSNGPILDYPGIIEGRTRPPVGLDEIYKKDAFICDVYGLPIFCNSCWVWKPDRTHHCSEVNRCVRRMDHYCPWVGGIISETTMKFFMQFVFYALIFCTFLLASTAFAISNRQSKDDDVNLHWIICLAMYESICFFYINIILWFRQLLLITCRATLFALLSFGMILNTLQLAIVNHTTVERLWKGERAYYIASLISEREARKFQSNTGYFHHSHKSEKPKPYHTITYPLKSENLLQPPDFNNPRQNENSITLNSSLPKSERTFAILGCSANANPWNLGLLENMKEILGDHWLDWFIPIRLYERNMGLLSYPYDYRLPWAVGG